MRASTYIDCTGDADLCAMAGVPFQKGDDAGTMQPATHCFILSNVNEEAYRNGPSVFADDKDSIAWLMAEDPAFPLIQDAHFCQNLVGPGTVGFNAGHLWDVDGTDPDSLTQAMIQGRQLARQIRGALAKYHPRAFGNAFLTVTAPLMGIRETRRIEGDYRLTLEDWLSRATFEDEICRNAYFIDIHTAHSEIAASLANREIVVDTRFEHYGPGESHGIPYRCLLPKGVYNVLTAGRAISCDRPVQGSVRVMPVCMAMGEAAGIAAAWASRENGDVRAVDVDGLRARLLEQGAYLPGQGG
jgi:hypothetical protein